MRTLDAVVHVVHWCVPRSVGPYVTRRKQREDNARKYWSVLIGSLYFCFGKTKNRYSGLVLSILANFFSLSVFLSVFSLCLWVVTNEKTMVSKVAVLLTVLVAVGAVQKKGFAKKVDQLSPGISWNWKWYFKNLLSRRQLVLRTLIQKQSVRTGGRHRRQRVPHMLVPPHSHAWNGQVEVHSCWSASLLQCRYSDCQTSFRTNVTECCLL